MICGSYEHVKESDIAALLLNKSPSSFQLLNVNLLGAITNISAAQRYQMNTKLNAIDLDTGLCKNCDRFIIQRGMPCWELADSWR